MARKSRDNKAREKDHELTQAEFEKNATKIIELNLQGKSHWCEAREQQIAPAVCKKVQSTAGCPIGPINKEAKTGCPCWETELNSKAQTKPRKKKGSGPSKNSYQTIMSKFFFENGVATLDQLVEAINSDPTRQGVKRPADHKNVSVGISILKNATRVKNPLRIEYSRISKLYYYLDHEDAATQYKMDMAKIDEDKKAKRKAAAKAKKAEEAKGKKTPSGSKKAVKEDVAKKQTLKELRARAKKKGIKGYTTMTKKALLDALAS